VEEEIYPPAGGRQEPRATRRARCRRMARPWLFFQASVLAGQAEESGRLPVIPARGGPRLPTLPFGGCGQGFLTHQLPPKATRPSADGAPGDRRALRQRSRRRTGRVAAQAQVALDPSQFGALHDGTGTGHTLPAVGDRSGPVRQSSPGSHPGSGRPPLSTPSRSPHSPAPLCPLCQDEVRQIAPSNLR
jgi:hypothetical protein